MVISVHTGCCVCISSAGRQCPGAGSGLPSSTDGGGACQFVEPRARASCWALRHLNAFLDYFDNSTPSKHPVFGKVVDGMDVVSAIEGVLTDGRDKPIDAVRVESITIAE